MILTQEEIKARVAAIQQGEATEVQREKAKSYRYIRPFVDAADGLVSEFTSNTGRFYFGMPSIDRMMRGIGRGQLCMISGKSHNGKTQLALNAVANNPHKRVLWFTPDESAELVLAKLVALKTGVEADEIERLVRAGDERMLAEIRRLATVEYRNLLVIDDTLSVKEMGAALDEAEHLWEAPCDLVVVDFIDLVASDTEASDPKTKAKQVKAFLKKANVPGIVLAQNSRTSSPPGKPAGMTGMAYGGESEAIFVIEVYRKMFDQDMDEFDRRRHANTVTINLCKNKRPPCHKGEVDLYMDPTMGIVREMQDADFDAMRKPKAAVAWEARKASEAS